MATHDELLEEAKEAVNRVFNDKSVPQSTTRESLEALDGEIEIMLESLD